ncbi:MAG TPA: hypothetical protein DEP84_17175 [Chloroflexi bacterium]|nr:hypothetical protein [Chloroflexota bacterium]
MNVTRNCITRGVIHQAVGGGAGVRTSCQADGVAGRTYPPGPLPCEGRGRGGAAQPELPTEQPEAATQTAAETGWVIVLGPKTTFTEAELDQAGVPEEIRK